MLLGIEMAASNHRWVGFKVRAWPCGELSHVRARLAS